MKRLPLFLIVLLVLIIYSCGNNSSMKSNLAVELSDRAFDVALPPPPAQEVSIDRKIIREGNLSFETKDINATRVQIGQYTMELKGYIASENAWKSEDQIQHTLELRVPAVNFDMLLSKITENAGKIDSRNIQTQDVTEEFIDVEARLKTKKELESRYLELLKKAVKVEEILSIEKEMGTLRGEIESVEGRLKYLNDKVSFSKLSVTYYQKIKSPFQFSSKFSDSLKGGWRNLMWFFIGLVNLWPFLIIIVAVVIFVLRTRRKNKIKKI